MNKEMYEIEIKNTGIKGAETLHVTSSEKYTREDAAKAVKRHRKMLEQKARMMRGEKIPEVEIEIED